MNDRPNDADLHRLLDGELDASSRLRLEERLRRSPVARAELDELQALDRTLRAALGPTADDARQVDAIATRAAAAVASRRGAPPAGRVITAPRGRLLRARVVAGIAAALLVTVGLHALLAAWLRNDETGPMGDDPSVVAALRQENERLKARLRDFDRPAPTFADPGAPMSPPTAAVEPAPAVGHPTEPAPTVAEVDTADERAAVRADLERLLDEARRKGGILDRRALASLFARLKKLGTALTDSDFRDFQALFHQQPNPSPGQLAVAQALSRFFNHLDGARTFAFQQLDTDLARMQQQPGYVGDRHLRRAWTEAIAFGRQDARSARYLERIGMVDRDWLNRRNAMAGLVRQGTSESVAALARIAASESNPLLKYEAVSYLSSLLQGDPTIVQANPELTKPLVEIAAGEIGANGDHSDAMYWALMILNKLGIDISALHSAFIKQNQNSANGDPRLANPDGSPIKENP